MFYLQMGGFVWKPENSENASKRIQIDKNML